MNGYCLINVLSLLCMYINTFLFNYCIPRMLICLYLHLNLYCHILYGKLLVVKVDHRFAVVKCDHFLQYIPLEQYGGNDWTDSSLLSSSSDAHRRVSFFLYSRGSSQSWCEINLPRGVNWRRRFFRRCWRVHRT